MNRAEELKSSGLKATLPRLKILEVFERSPRRHLAAEDVYRVLVQFEQAGLLRRSNFESAKAVFELDRGEHHDHLVCLSCGLVEEFYDPEIEKRQREIAAARGFELQDHALALYAHCSKADCPNRRG